MNARPIIMSRSMVIALLAGRKLQTRRIVNFKTLSVTLPQPVAPDFADVLPGAGPSARAGRSHATLNQNGAVAVVRPGASPLGVKPGEFDFNCPYADGITRIRPNRQGWEIVPHPGQRLWVREKWKTEERESDSVDGIRFAADDAFVPIANTRRAANRWIEANDNGKFGTAWRPSIYLPRWASRISLEVTGVRLQRVNQIDFGDIRREGVDCPEHDFPGGFCCSECASLRAAFAKLWDRINGKRAPWESNPFVWAIEFKRVDARAVAA